LTNAKADYIYDIGDSTEPYEYPEWHDKVLKQFNLFGDPEVPIWINIPKKLNITEISSLDESTTFQISTDDIPIENSIITLIKENKLFWKGETNEKGIIELPFKKDQIKLMTLTASKMGYVPHQIEPTEMKKKSISIKGYDILTFSMIILGLISIYFIHKKQDSLKINQN